MYMGRHKVQRVRSHADALRVLESCRYTPKKKLLRQEREWGYPLAALSQSGTWVRECGGAVIFRLYGTDVVAWSEDGAVTIEGWPSVTTSNFAAQLLPDGVALRLDTTVRFHRGPTLPADNDWRGWWRGQELCNAKHPVTFRPSSQGGWEPDADDVARQPIQVAELDRKLAREVSQRHHFAKFRLWLEMVTVHKRQPLMHRDEDYGLCLELCEQRDFRSAAMHLPLIRETRAFNNYQNAAPLNIETSRGYVSMRSLQRLRDYAYGAVGAFVIREFPTLPQGKLEAWRKRENALVAAGVHL